ncbi:unnamed protein product [Closterium sp. NIES-53]
MITRLNLSSCYLCVPPDPGIEAAALRASESALSGTAPAKALHTFTLDSMLPAVSFATVPPSLHSLHLFRSNWLTPQGGQFSLVPPMFSCVRRFRLAVPSGSLSGLHLPSFLTNLVSTAALQVAMVTTTIPGGQHVSICTCTRTARHLATFTRRPGSSLYPLTTEPPQVSASPLALACPALLSLRRGAVARRSSLLLVSSDDCSPADSPHGSPHWLSHGGGSYLHDPCGYSPLSVAVCGPVRCASALPRVSLPETSPTLRWTGKVGDASVSGSGALVPLSAILPQTSSPPALFLVSSLAFPLMRLAGSFTTPPCAVSSRLRTSRASRGVASGGAASGGAEPEGAESGGAELGGAEPGVAEPGGAEPGGAESEGVEPGGTEPGGAELGHAEPGGAKS